ncbi:hypothetical protein CkaCkLH20_03002 [Colletotrichum karsti]|uniref:Uncharacterized protein n=1 Tax=Colletotrichum karsti TaxID=1095194 RepID=A0A9P6IBI1_9PEZI|nr:uncharacterized protein CkaCkLH20_03002 [Colletotrichum karsti]KAF9879459.1 hypothetical protein CkaCkLH20_03002 [Colletotrichum karsti]
MAFILDPRTPKGGGSSGGRGSSGGKSSSSKGSKGSKGSKNKYKGTGGYVGGGGGGGGGNNGFSHLPVWARVLIILAIIWFIIFLIALGYYVTKELKRKKDGKSFRLGHVVGHALLVSTGLWLPVWIYKKFVGGKKSESGSYAKIEEGHGKEGGGGNNHDSWYGGAGGENKYDAGSHPPAHRPQSPNPAPPPTQTGAAADYYNNMPAPPSHTAPTQHPPQYG